MAETKITMDCIAANNTEFSYLECGSGKLALLLHGFPDTAQTWRHLMPQLASAGYRVVAPFMRGFAPSAVPADGCYQTAMLARDANALHEELGGDGDAVIIGHDWGAVAAWCLALEHPQLVPAQVVLSVGHQNFDPSPITIRSASTPRPPSACSSRAPHWCWRRWAAA